MLGRGGPWAAALADHGVSQPGVLVCDSVNGTGGLAGIGTDRWPLGGSLVCSFSLSFRRKLEPSRWVLEAGIQENEISLKLFLFMFGGGGRRFNASCRVRGRVNVHHLEVPSEGFDWKEAASETWDAVG